MKEYEKAKSTYTKCNEEKCNCYSSVIDEDLRPFAKGISKRLLEAVKSKYMELLTS